MGLQALDACLKSAFQCPSISKHVFRVHHTASRVDATLLVPWLRKPGGVMCCVQGHAGGRTRLAACSWAWRAPWEDKSDPPWGSWVWELGLSRQLSTWLTCPTCSVDSGPGPELPCSGELGGNVQTAPRGRPQLPSLRSQPLVARTPGPTASTWELRASSFSFLPVAAVAPRPVPLRGRASEIRKWPAAGRALRR